MSHPSAAMVNHEGGCHCGRVRFRVRAPAVLDVLDCNCSICARTGFLHLVVPRDRFTLLRGQDDLTSYTFGTHTARHLFCRVCGIKSFYVPRSHPDGYSVNARCIDSPTVRGMNVQPFDGAHWERNAESIRGFR